MSLLTLSNTSLAMTGAVVDLSIPLHFDGAQPNHFGAEDAHAEPMRSGAFTGDTREGGSCNAASVTLNAHCNGTHTECVGHLTLSRVSINDVCPALPLMCLLVTLTPEATRYGDSDAAAVRREQLLSALEQPRALALQLTGAAPTALVIRTLPNSTAKLSKRYQSTADCAYIEPDATAGLVELGIDHLLVDLPSIDPYSDNGRLEAHRVMFGLPDSQTCPAPDIADAVRAHATVTEMVFIPDDVADGMYLLNLQVPAFELDAAPSRPLLYELESA